MIIRSCSHITDYLEDLSVLHYKFLTKAKVRTSVNPAWAISCLSKSQSVFSLNCKTKL